MSDTEKFCLRWNDFERNISGALKELKDDEDFFDVTLACDDNQLQAHKVILSACSSFFRRILKKNKHNHPLLYLKGVRHIDLVSVLNFMYYGEVSVAQEDLNTFLAVAEDLNVKGLTQTPPDSKADDPAPKVLQAAKPKPKDNSARASHNPIPFKQSHPISKPALIPSAYSYGSQVHENAPVKSEPIATVEETYASNNHEQEFSRAVVNPTIEFEEEYADYDGSFQHEDNSFDAGGQFESHSDNAGILYLLYIYCLFLNINVKKRIRDKLELSWTQLSLNCCCGKWS